jgi:hypothetical protein
MELLKDTKVVSTIHKKTYSGIPFIYLQPSSSITEIEIEELLKQAAIKVMNGKRLTYEITFVRKHSHSYVYRIRFKVPQEKLFCCGNRCSNCIRFKNN